MMHDRPYVLIRFLANCPFLIPPRRRRRSAPQQNKATPQIRRTNSVRGLSEAASCTAPRQLFGKGSGSRSVISLILLPVTPPTLQQELRRVNKGAGSLHVERLCG